MTVDEQVRKAHDLFKEHAYGRLPDVPAVVGSYPTEFTQTGTKAIDCTSLTAWVVMYCYPAAPWTFKHYRMLQVFNDNDKWSGPRAIEQVGIGVEVAEPQWGFWHYAQAWNHPTRLSAGGHSVLLKGLQNGRVEVLEATFVASSAGRPFSGVRLIERDWAHYKNKPGGVRIVRLFDR